MAIASPALQQATALLRTPMLAGAMREHVLPDGVLTLIKIAAGDAETLTAVAEETGESADRARQAAILYLQSVLLMPNADHYRTLGVDRGASQADLRLHLIWLMKWLHPDRTHSEWESAFAGRVLSAWDALKTPDRRRVYDRWLVRDRQRRDRRPVLRRRKRKLTVRGVSRSPRRPRLHVWRRKLLAIGICLVLAAVLWIASGTISGRNSHDAGDGEVGSLSLQHATVVGLSEFSSGSV